MAKINFVDKGNIEDLFGMSGGYVLDFSNKTFQEFIYEVLDVDVYLKYEDMSKAKMLRAIFNDYDNIKVGKLILEMLRYMQSKNMIDSKNEIKFKSVAELGNSLIGKTTKVIIKKEEKSVEPIKSAINFDFYTNELRKIYTISNAQERGYQFEKYLSKLFETFNLEPRGSFKIKGEQIDGSFILHNEVYLLEAKWTKDPIAKDDLVVFNEKVSSKSGFTRGLFISLSGYTNDAVNTFSNGRTINIVLMNVVELGKTLATHNSVTELISKKVRLLCEEGTCYREIDIV